LWVVVDLRGQGALGLNRLDPRFDGGKPIETIVPGKLFTIPGCEERMDRRVTFRSVCLALAWAKAVTFEEEDIAKELCLHGNSMSFEEMLHLGRQIKTFRECVWHAVLPKLLEFFICEKIKRNDELVKALKNTFTVPIMCVNSNALWGSGTTDVAISCSDTCPGLNLVGKACEKVRASLIQADEEQTLALQINAGLIFVSRDVQETA
jgi:predicted NAD-dependent protein-ADP-ribosyltransferase YbiA (DUF1768 family)